MISPGPMPLTVQDAEALLKDFICNDVISPISEEENAKIQQALLLLTHESDYQMLGICADSMAQALTTLKQYLKALEYSINVEDNPLEPLEGAVYLKFNGRNQTFYLSSYLDKYRGVLISFQSTEEDGINGVYGHFPLDLFA
ncbi:hypothetical protein PCC9214_00855 [Planktothrix tepida]|uniref:DUF1824 domain-containing protein n=1 Tax=Planktothrix tepida PCC 9214 TaxID=671072 RepID=A0A1J1LEZ5_9CYAN|nr:DUF1824 family protein [Planktothrix tepida]CAD5924135.1 hypothetical protein PCC9214_00855 [Planktothrix tepida]CUR31151.1 conserved hypothetical protein [Planktothrix tepida PCC 9214]